jgi:hypothetical protein
MFDCSFAGKALFESKQGATVNAAQPQSTSAEIQSPTSIKSILFELEIARRGAQPAQTIQDRLALLLCQPVFLFDLNCHSMDLGIAGFDFNF